MGKREEKLGLVEEESVNGGIVFGKCRRKRSTAGEAESKAQSSASCTVHCPARRSSTTQKGARIPRRVYVRTSTYILLLLIIIIIIIYIRLYGRICAAISKLAQARPTMPVFL